MTESTITRERARQIFLGNGPEPSASEERELARMALAAMDSEPVAEVCEDYAIRYISNGPAPKEGLRPGDKLYRHAQPVPVVPDELNTRTANDVMNEHLSWKDYGDAEVFCIAWNACRAAMLAAAPQLPGSEPATVPGKWIPVSERMPESNGVYFGWDGKRVLEVNCFFGGFSANQFIHGEITHWMPLPAAPQEVNHG